MSESTPFCRREFLKRFLAMNGCWAATASPLAQAAAWLAQPESTSFKFPQGIASADPQPDSIMLWTRVLESVDDAGGGCDPIELRLMVAEEAQFEYIVLDTQVEAGAPSDHTVRCFVDGLKADRHYFYRFVAPDGTSSPIGRTRTAPGPDAMRPLNIAVFSCQHYNDGFFGAYRRLIVDDESAEHGDRIDVVAHMGDYIYEYLDAIMPAAGGGRLDLRDRDGNRRGMRPVPSGVDGSQKTVSSLEGYRHLYRKTISDPDLQAARARYPFIHVWDDHEIVNDYWQSFAKDGAMQQRKVDANQAWFEYIPAILSQSDPGPAGINAARDFERVAVRNHPPENLDDHYFAQQADNQAAVAAISVYRSFKWGRLADLFAVDGRSYRGERGVDSGLLKGSLAAYPLSPVDPAVVETLNAGRNANGGSPPATVSAPGGEIPNPRRNAPTGSLLGRQQKTWLKRSIAKSGAVWKVVLNDVPLMRFGFDISFRPGGPRNGLLWTDSWDGYPVERRELMAWIRDQRIPNVLSLTGDRHAHFAGVVLDDFDGDDPAPVVAEFACASVSAVDRASAHGRVLNHEPDMKPLFTFDGRTMGLSSAHVPSLNSWLLYGADSALELTRTGQESAALKRGRKDINPHLNYADTNAYGYFIARLRQSHTDIEFVTVPQPTTDHGPAGPPVVRRVHYRVKTWTAGDQPELSLSGLEGEAPLLGLRGTPKETN